MLLDDLVEAGEQLVERPWLVYPVDREGGHAAERDRRDRAERPEADPGGAQLVALVDVERLAAARDHTETGDLRGQVAEAAAGSVRRRGDGAREGLRVDVALVLH